MKKALALLISIALILTSTPVDSLYADEPVIISPKLQEKLAEVNAEMTENYGISEVIFESTIPLDTNKTLTLNESLAFGDYPDLYSAIMVYGNPFGKPGDKIVSGHKRYFGYTRYGDLFTDFYYPDDAYSGWKFDTLERAQDIKVDHWVIEPWTNKGEKVKETVNGKFDLAPYKSDQVETAIEKGIAFFYGANGTNVAGYITDKNGKIKTDKDGEPIMRYGGLNGSGEIVSGGRIGDVAKFKDIKWVDYVHIMQPPGKYTWGIGKMWHRKPDGSIWYVTVPIYPLEETTDEPLILDGKSKYVIVSSGFINDGSTATADFRDEQGTWHLH